MAISPIGSSPIAPIQIPTVGKPEQAENGGGFAEKLTGALDNLQQTQNTSADLAMKMATGDLSDIHDYMIASNRAAIATELTVAVRNKAVESFNQIMNMQV